MKTSDFSRYALSISAAVAMLAGCGGGTAPISPPALVQQAARHASAKPTIQNLIVIVQHDRSFDNLFAGYRGADAMVDPVGKRKIARRFAADVKGIRIVKSALVSIRRPVKDVDISVRGYLYPGE